MPKRLSIVIPVYNEAATAATLINNVLAFPLDGFEKEIIVVESNSTDGSREIIQEFAARGQVKAFYEDRPQGKGHAVKTGLSHTTGDIVLIQDADLEYRVEDYPALLAPIQQGATSFVLGSRHLGREDWRYRRSGAGKWLGHLMDLGVWIYTQFFNLVYQTSLTDPATMFKVFRRSCLNGITFRSDGFELDWEIVAKLMRQGFKPLEIPVSYQSRSYAEGKKIRIWRDGRRSLIAILRFRFGPL